MRLMLHILKKDARRLWLAVLVTLALLAALADSDRWRADWLAGSTEGWLNLLLPLAWACLIALVVHEEPLVGDRQFWITWPYRWPALLGAKALFAAIFIHVPSLLADAAVLAFHGFQPLEYISRLIWKQVVLAAVVTVPAMGLATLFKSIVHFVLAAIVIAGAAIYLAGTVDPVRVPWIPIDGLRRGLSIFVITLGAGAIVEIQYARRRTVPSRIVGTVAVLAGALLFKYLPPTFTTRIRSALQSSTHPDVTLRLFSSRLEPPPAVQGARNEPMFAHVALPITLSGVSDPSGLRFGQPVVEIVGPDGQRYKTGSPIAYRNFEKIDLVAYTLPYGQSPGWLVLGLRRSVLEKIKDGKVNLRAASAVTFHRQLETTWISIGASQAVAGVGRCSSTVIETPNIYQESMLKVLCESPSTISPQTEVRLWQPETGREWRHHLGDSAPAALGLREVWLSPLDRLQTFFHLISDLRDDSPGARWLVPSDALTNGRLAITPDVITAWAAVDFELRDITLREYMLKTAR